jgi:hypothetical protein
MFQPFVQTLYYDNAKRFLDLSEMYEAEENHKFNFLILPSTNEPPLDYSRKAANYHGILKFGTVLPIDKSRVARYLKTTDSNNFILGYVNHLPNGRTEKIFIPQIANISSAMNLVNTAKRHTIVEINKNNFYEHCVKKIENCDSPTICVIAVLNDYKSFHETMSSFQAFVHVKFDSKIKLLQRTPLEIGVCAIQYGFIQARLHHRLANFVLEHNLERYSRKSEGMDFIIIESENEKFEILTPSKGIDINKAIKRFLSSTDNSKADYIGNYNINFADLLEEKRNGIINVLIICFVFIRFYKEI